MNTLLAQWQRVFRPILEPSVPVPQTSTASAPSRALVFFCVFVIVLGSWWWNREFGDSISLEKLAAMNDVPDILRGYEKTPDLWRDGLRWWHGPWIQEGIGAFRPISSYLLWIESAIGIRFGFGVVAWLGIALVALNSALCAALAWTFTRHWLPMVVAALLAPSARLWLMGGAPIEWMAWYAGHHDLWMIACLLTALLAWTQWLQSGSRRALWLAWAAFVVGALSKEFVYIFPAMALAVGWTLPQTLVSREVSRRLIWQHIAGLFGFAILLYLYRQQVLPVAYNPPPLKTVHFIRRPFLYWLPSFYKYVLTNLWFLPALALWFVVAAGLWIRGYRLLPRTPLFRWLPPLIILGGAFLCGALTIGIGEGFWYLFEPHSMRMRIGDLLQMMVMFYLFWLILKYRHREPTLAVTLVFMLSYVPVWTYLGWHYTIAGWFVRAALWWPLAIKLLLLELEGWSFFMRLKPTETPKVAVQNS